jgi:hypothetical protein
MSCLVQGLNHFECLAASAARRFCPANALDRKFIRLIENILYHEAIRTTFYPHIFRNTKVADFDLQNAPRHSFKNESKIDTFSGGFLAILTAAVLFIGFGWLNLRKRISNF